MKEYIDRVVYYKYFPATFINLIEEDKEVWFYRSNIFNEYCAYINYCGKHEIIDNRIEIDRDEIDGIIRVISKEYKININCTFVIIDYELNKSSSKGNCVCVLVPDFYEKFINGIGCIDMISILSVNEWIIKEIIE